MRSRFFSSLALFGSILLVKGADRPSVQISESPAAFIISNDVVAVRINKASGEFSLAYGGQEVITKGYWSQVGGGAGGSIARFGSKRSSAITIGPAQNE